jgi:hypothetical protein
MCDIVKKVSELDDDDKRHDDDDDDDEAIGEERWSMRTKEKERVKQNSNE